MADQTLATYWRRSVSEHPDAVALDTFTHTYTYTELDDLAARIAGSIARCALAPRSRIGLLAIRETGTYAGYLAITQLGHAVVPLDPQAPLARTASVVKLAGLACVVLTPAAAPDLAAMLTEAGIAVVDPEVSHGAVCDIQPDPVHLEDIAYILFTSGSTGRPKGVPIRHRHVAAYLERVIPHGDLGEGMRLSQTFALTFDPSVFDLFAAWGSGATLVVPRPRELLVPVTYVNTRRLTHWFSVPSLISHARRLNTLRPGAMPGLVRSAFIGEPLTLQQAQAWAAAAPGGVLENVYGPTELTIACSSAVLPRDPETWPSTVNGTVPIGTVYPALDWLVVDADGRQAGEGELLIRGPQRFSGYLDLADDAGRFSRRDDDGLHHPHTPGEIVSDSDYYRTGDRVIVHGETLVHLGRLDRQTKVDGYRIELGEIEGTMREHPGVLDVAVVTTERRPGPGLALAAAVSGQGFENTDLQRFLRKRLPGYMIPETMVPLAELPLNRSGKVDYLEVRRLLEEHQNA